MKYLTYSGNNLLNVELPDDAAIYYPPVAVRGIPKADIGATAMRAFDAPLDMEPLGELVHAGSKILIAFDDNCQPFPAVTPPDPRQLIIEPLIDKLLGFGVKAGDIHLICAVALHRKMKKDELETMLGARIMREFYPDRCTNFDAEDAAMIERLEDTDEGEPVEVDRRVVESDLVIYVDTVQVPLNGGHKSVAIGLGTYRSIASHHHPKMTVDCPHVMQPKGSNMHACVERLSRVILKHTRIMVIECAMNGETYPWHLRFLGKPPSHCNVFEMIAKRVTPTVLKPVPEPIRQKIFSGIQSAYAPIAIHAGDIDAVHTRTLRTVNAQMTVEVPKQYDVLVFGLPDLSPYSVGARINPVLVLSDMLGYIYNWFYNRPLVKKGGAVVLLNPVFEVFHSEYHVAYEKFWHEVLPETNDPFEMQTMFQEKFATDSALIDAYRNNFAHHGFHPFTVWYWATYALRNLSKIILVGPPTDHVAKRLGVDWAANTDTALGMAKEASGGTDIVALTMPPFLYVNVAEPVT